MNSLTSTSGVAIEAAPGGRLAEILDAGALAFLAALHRRFDARLLELLSRRMTRQKRFDATKIHTHTFALEDLPTAIRYAKDRVDDAIKVVVKARGVAAHRVAAE